MTISRAQMYRQLYQMGGMGQMGIESLSPMQPAMQPAMQSAMYSPLQNNYSGMPMMANGGIANLVNREKYGIGSKLKKFVRNIIPNEVAEIAVKAAPFVAPFNPLLAGAMAGFGGFDQTGRIGSSLKNAALVYGAGQLARGIGGAGFQEGFNPFAGFDASASFGGLGSLFTSPMGNVPFGSFTPTPTQQYYTGGVDAYIKPPDVAGNIYGSTPTSPTIGTVIEGPGGGTVVENLSLPSTDVSTNVVSNVASKATEGPGYVELIKKAGSFENVPLSERFGAVKDLGSKALQDIFYKPIRNKDTGAIMGYDLDKNAVFGVVVGASSYAEALGLLGDAGVPDPEKVLTEEEYQRLKVQPEKEKYTNVLKPGSFGIRPQSADGGRIGYGLGDLVRGSGMATAIPGGNVSESRGLGGMIQRLIQQNPQMFKAQMSASRRDFIDNDNNGIDDREEAAGGGLMDGGVLSIKLTPAQAMAMGGRIGYQVGGNINPFALTQRPDDLGLPGFDDDNLSQNREPTLEEAMARGVIFYDPIAGFQVNPLTGGRMGTGMDPNFIARRAMQAEQDAAARTLPVNVISRGVSSNFLSPNQSMKQDLLMRQGSVQTGGTPRSASEGSTGINPLFAINRLIQAEQDAAARVTPKMAKGGKINYPMGNEIPVRQNQGGVTELDLRNKGGFIPVGIKEKADDVPAMLSRNEFVFTADAVRGAGGGSINKGAQKMYKLMKSLEKKVKKMKKVA